MSNANKRNNALTTQIPDHNLCKVCVVCGHCRQYFVLMFKDKPFELWDLRSGTLLRQMPKNFPHITALVSSLSLLGISEQHLYVPLVDVLNITQQSFKGVSGFYSAGLQNDTLYLFA